MTYTNSDQRWYDLLDQQISALEQQEGYDFVLEYCRLTKRTSRHGVETALRNINNWRRGHHRPNRRNFQVLTKLLAIEENAGLFREWCALYNDAAKFQTSSTDEPGSIRELHNLTGRPNNWFRARIAGPVLASLLIVAVTYSWASNSGWQDNHIPFRPNLTLKIGEETVIHGHRGKCGQSAPTEEITRKRLPNDLKTGTLVAGKIGSRYSRHCQGQTQAREVIFKATKTGTDRFTIFKDPMTITVTDH